MNLNLLAVVLRMDKETIIINTGPLILLGKIGALDIAGQLPVAFISPPAVLAELEAGVSEGHMEINPSWLEIQPLRSALSPMVALALDRGEAEVIQLALDLEILDVCLDDLRGRNVAKAIGLRVTGLLGILARAKLVGLIPRLRPYTDSLLRVGGRYSPALVHRFLTEFGE